MNEFKAAQAEAARKAVFQQAIDDVKAELYAMRAMIAAPAPILASAVKGTEYGAAPQRYPVEHEGDGSCGCVDSSCCSFDIVLDKIRATRPQIEPADAGEVPLLINAMEIQLFAEADGFGIMFPSLLSTLDLRIENVVTGGSPGPWVNVNRVMNRVSVKKGASRIIDFSIQVRESDEGAEQATLAGKDESGEYFGQIELNCCVSKIYPSMTPEISLLHGGEGRGKIQAVVFARRVCCC